MNSVLHVNELAGFVNAILPAGLLATAVPSAIQLSGRSGVIATLGAGDVGPDHPLESWAEILLNSIQDAMVLELRRPWPSKGASPMVRRKPEGIEISFEEDGVPVTSVGLLHRPPARG